MHRTRFGSITGILFAVSSSLSPALTRGQAGEDAILLGATAPEESTDMAARWCSNKTPEQILQVRDELNLDSWPHGTTFAPSREAVFEQLGALVESDRESPDAQPAEQRVESPEAQFLSRSLDAQSDALMKTSRALLDIADLLERQQLPRRADTLRVLAKRTRAEALDSNKGSFESMCQEKMGLVIVYGPDALDHARDLADEWERLPKWLNPRTEKVRWGARTIIEFGDEFNLLPHRRSGTNGLRD